LFRLLKKLHRPTLLAWVPRGVEKRGMRRIFVYAAVTSFDANEADGLFQQPVKETTGAHNVSDIKQAIKEMLVKRLKLKMDAAAIKDEAPLFGDDGLGLDSIDALELVVGLQKEYGVVINDKAVAERALVSVNTIAEYVSANKTV